MPTVPAGGLSIFVNVAIFVLGGFFKIFRNKGYSIPVASKAYNYFVSKESDSFGRRMIGYSLVTTLFVLMSVTTSISIYNRIMLGSNIELVKKGTEKIILIYRDIFDGSRNEDAISAPETRVDYGLLSYNIKQ